MNNSIVPVTEPTSQFALLMKQADILANSRIIPKVYQNRSADVVAAGLAGMAYGWDVMTSLRNYHVIEGTASLRPEAMLGLVRRQGHSVKLDLLTDASGKVAVATGRRADNGDEHTSKFSHADAVRANLANKSNWKTYEDAMLTWRAVSALCRVLFPDVVLGAGYAPEEIGAEVTVDGIPADADPFAAETVTAAHAKQELIEVCEGDIEQAKELWGDRKSNPIGRSELDALLKQALEQNEIVEAIIVEADAEIVPAAIEAQKPSAPKRAKLGSRADATDSPGTPLSVDELADAFGATTESESGLVARNKTIN